MSIDPRTPPQLYLIRHGATAWTETGQHTSRTDLVLSAGGEAEARALEPRLRDIAFAHVLISPRQRARQTCELAGLGAQADVDPDLAEWDYGDYEGRSSADIHRTSPHWNLFLDGCPHGESPQRIADRADRLIERLRVLNGPIALFTHGQFGCALAARWIGLPVIDAEHFALSTATLSLLDHATHHPEVPVIALWNSEFPERPLLGRAASAANHSAACPSSVDDPG